MLVNLVHMSIHVVDIMEHALLVVDNALALDERFHFEENQIFDEIHPN
jgi:hypothetical protein